MLSGPGVWSESCQMLHAHVGQAGENGRQIVSHRDFQPPTGFNYWISLRMTKKNCPRGASGPARLCA